MRVKHALRASKAINTLLARGERSFNVAEDLASAISRMLESAHRAGESSWRVRRMPCANQEEVTTLIVESAEDVVGSPTMNTPNPYFSPKAAKKASAEHIVKIATQINENLAAGHRTFNVPFGIAEDVAQALRDAHEEGECGWTVTVKPSAEAPKNLKLLEVTDPE